MLDRIYAPAVAAILAAMAFVMISTARLESATYDEPLYIASGYSYWVTADFRLNREHPPLAKLLQTLPLLPRRLPFPTNSPAWAAADGAALGSAFLYHSRADADAMLFECRMVSVVLTLLLGALLAFWTRSKAGSWAGLIAVTLFAFDPNVVANGRYATNDVPCALFAFLALIAFDRAWDRGKPLDYAAAGLALGLAVATKASAWFLVPALLILATARRKEMRGAAIGGAVALACAVIAMLVVSRGDWQLYSGEVAFARAHVAGQLSYLFGMESTQGWWWYFPAAFAVKSPLGLLALLAFAAWSLARARITKDLSLLLVPVAVYGAACLFARSDLGVRYLLPIYPMLFALVGIACARLPWRVPVALALAAAVAEALAVYPNELAFFNLAAGGPAAGPRYLIDANLDWGQDLKKLRPWLAAHGTDRACLAYFGTADIAYYGIRANAVPGYWQLRLRRNLHCYTAVSATYLYGKQFIGGDTLRWLRDRVPVARVGYSIYVYDTRDGDRAAPLASAAATPTSAPAVAAVAGGALVADGGTNAVYALAPGTMRRIAGSFRDPEGVVAAPNGDVFVADAGDDAVKRIGRNGRVTSVGSGFSRPEGVALDARGDLYVTDTGHGDLKRVSPDGRTTLAAGGFREPEAVAVGKDGTVYVADTFDDSLAVLSPNRMTRRIRGFDRPCGVSVDGAGNVFVADSNHNRVVRITKRTIAPAGSGFVYPCGVAVEPNGSILVGDTYHDAVKRVTPSGIATLP